MILVANHASHMDTPVILSALPRKLRKRTAVAAAADYFYRNRLVASIVVAALQHGADRPQGRRRRTKGTSHLDKLLDDGWNLLLYPEGTRSRGDGLGRVRRGAAVLASHAQPLDRADPRHRHRRGDAARQRSGRSACAAGCGHTRHRVEVSFGEPIPPLGDTAALIERVQSFFESGESGPPKLSPYRRRGRKSGMTDDG